MDDKTNDKMEQLRKERDERGILEKARLNFWAKKEEEKERRHNVLAAVDGLLDLKYQSDYQLLFGLFLDWLKKAKNEKQKETLNYSFNAMMRIQSYVSTLQTVSKSATGEMLDERHRNNKLHIKISELEKTVKTLKAEIEHYEQQ